MELVPPNILEKQMKQRINISWVQKFSTNRKEKDMGIRTVCILAFSLFATSLYATPRKTTFDIDLPSSIDRNPGGLIATDLDNDGDMEIILTYINYIAAYELDGTQMWKRTDDISVATVGHGLENDGYPGRHAPGVQVANHDAGTPEVFYLMRNGKLQVLNAQTGAVLHTKDLPMTDSDMGKWTCCAVANFEGKGDVDMLLATADNVRSGSYKRLKKIAAYRIFDLINSGPAATRLWKNDDFVCQSHNQPLCVDLNKDGRDEVIGASVIDFNGKEKYRAIDNTAFPHIDSIAIADIDPDLPNMEVCVPVEAGPAAGGTPEILFNNDGEIWRYTAKMSTDGDKVVVGDFDTARSGLELFFRGNSSDDMFVLDKDGNKIADYYFANTRPNDWYFIKPKDTGGIENLWTINWTGGQKQYIAAKERHINGKVGLFDPMTGKIIMQIATNTDRLYVCDVQGDWREEMIVVNAAASRIEIYENTNPNERPSADFSLWNQQQYRRGKMTWGYYTCGGVGIYGK